MANPAGLYRLIIEQGASAIRNVTWTDEDGNTPDLSTGYTAELVIADDYETAAALTLTDSSGITLGASGSIVFSITATQSAALDAGAYVWRLDITHTASGRVDRILKGPCLVEAEAGS